MQNEAHSKSVYKWILNLGASKHMTLHRTAFQMYEVIILRNIHLGDNNIVQTIEMRSIIMKAMLEGKINQICINDVLHVPKLHTNLLPMSKIVSNGLKV